MMFRGLEPAVRAAAFAAAVGLTGPAFATYMADISYTFTDNGGGNFTFDFLVANTSTGASTAPLDFFDVFFDADNPALYSNVSVLADNGWLASAFENDPLPGGEAGGASFDAFQATPMLPGIAQGDSLGGFLVNFDYVGSLDPTEHAFFWLADFGTNFDGNGIQINSGPDVWVLGTVEGATRARVPAPGTLALLGLGFLGLGAIRRRAGPNCRDSLRFWLTHRPAIDANPLISKESVNLAWFLHS